MATTWLKRLGSQVFGRPEGKPARRRTTRLGLEALEVREVPALVSLAIDSVHTVKAGDPVQIALTGYNGQGSPVTGQPSVTLTIDNAGHTNTTTKTLDATGHFSWSRSFNYAGKTTISATVNGTTFSDTIHVKPVLGIGTGATPADVQARNVTRWWLTPNTNISEGSTLYLTLVAYNADGTQASNFSGNVSLSSNNTAGLALKPEAAYAVVVHDDVLNMNVVVNTYGQSNGNGTYTYTRVNGLAGAEADAIAKPTATTYYMLTAYTTDATGAVVSSQGLRVYVS